MSGLSLRLPVALGLFLCGTASAQQFTPSTSILPTNNTWSEGVECVDVDNDGDLDLVFANGDGFSFAGTQRQNLLLINQLVPTGTLTFTDESIARLGVNLSNGKGVTTADVNGDGWMDLLYLNAFNTDPPHLYINQGAANPGFFTLESALRGFTQNLNSASAQFGDVDDDGDLDCVVMDAGAQFLSGSGGVPKLYINDGAGFFTDTPSQFPAPIKVAHQDAQLVDVDGDWDLDFLGFNRASNGGGTHYLMLNDGTGSFTNASTTLPNTGSLVYEADCGDLDGDGDIDLFYTSLSGFNEGYQQNQLEETGALSFTSGAPLGPGVDDNEIALFDYDNDGDYDVLVGSLGSRERMYQNNGGLSFTEDIGSIQNVSDSTLDVAVGDLDNDGDYDFVTAQGESGSFVNRVYINSGSQDTRAPLIMRTDMPSLVSSWPAIAKAEVSDQVRDDGVDYITGKALIAPLGGDTVIVDFIGGGWSPSNVNLGSGDTLVLRNLDPGFIVLQLEDASSTVTLVQNQLYEQAFLAPGSFGFTELNSTSTGSVTVSGTPNEIDGVRIGGGQHRFEIPDQGKPFLLQLSFTDWNGNTSSSAATVVDFAPVGGTNYCATVANSTGLSGAISATGTDLAGSNFLVLNATNLPQGEFGFLLTSLTQDQVAVPALSPGFLCLGGQIGRFITQVQNSGPSGSMCVRADVSALPVTPAQAVAPGESWNFQFWYRDGSSSNFTDGIEVTFQ